MLYLIEVSTKFANQISTQPRALNRPCIMDTVSELANSRLTLLHVDIAQKERRCRYFARLILYLGFGFTKSCIFFQVFASFICLPDNPLQLLHSIRRARKSSLTLPQVSGDGV